MKLQTHSGTTSIFTKNPVIYFYVIALILMLFLSWQYERVHKAEAKAPVEKVDK